MITFTEAMDDPAIFAGYFHDPNTWRAWRTLAKVIFGEPLTPDELQIYNDCAQRSDTPTSGFDELWAVCGRGPAKA